MPNKIFDQFQGQFIQKDGVCYRFVGQVSVPPTADNTGITPYESCETCGGLPDTPTTVPPVITTTVAPTIPPIVYCSLEYINCTNPGDILYIDPTQFGNGCSVVGAPDYIKVGLFCYRKNALTDLPPQPATITSVGSCADPSCQTICTAEYLHCTIPNKFKYLDLNPFGCVLGSAPDTINVDGECYSKLSSSVIPADIGAYLTVADCNDISCSDFCTAEYVNCIDPAHKAYLDVTQLGVGNCVLDFAPNYILLHNECFQVSQLTSNPPTFTEYISSTDCNEVGSDVPIPVVNHSFETPELSSGFENGFVGWLDTLGNFAGTQYMSGVPTITDPPDGTERVAFSNFPSIFQVTDTPLKDNSTYILTVNIGDRNDLSPGAPELRLGSGPTFDEDLLTITNVINPPTIDGDWVEWSTTFSSSGGIVGDMLRIELVNTGGTQALYDNVRLVESNPMCPSGCTAEFTNCIDPNDVKYLGMSQFGEFGCVSLGQAGVPGMIKVGRDCYTLTNWPNTNPADIEEWTVVTNCADDSCDSCTAQYTNCNNPSDIRYLGMSQFGEFGCTSLEQANVPDTILVDGECYSMTEWPSQSVADIASWVAVDDCDDGLCP